MRVGTKSVLFGVHQFLWHPFTVWLAFRRVHGRWPNWWENIGILCHDTFGYWGKIDMDGPSGIDHPETGARVAAWIVSWFSLGYAWDVFTFCVYHSSTYAKRLGEKPSALYLPDKVSILMEPKWWYLFRARLSGEVTEYVRRSPIANDSVWYDWYKRSVERKLNHHEKNSTHPKF